MALRFSEEGAKEMTPKAFGSLANTHTIETFRGPNEHVNWYKDIRKFEDAIDVNSPEINNVGVDTII